MHPAEFRVDAVVVNRQTGARTDHHVGLLMLKRRRISIVLRAHTSPRWCLSWQRKRGRFALCRRGRRHIEPAGSAVETAPGPPSSPSADGLHMVFVLLAEDVVFSQVPLHSLGVVEPPQRTANSTRSKPDSTPWISFSNFAITVAWRFSFGLRCGFGHPTTYTSEKRQHCLRLCRYAGRMASCGGLATRRGKTSIGRSLLWSYGSRH